MDTLGVPGGAGPNKATEFVAPTPPGSPTFNDARQAIIDGLTSAQSEATGWNAVVKAGLAVTAVVRTSNTRVTITLPAFASYDINANETVTATVPSTAIVKGGPLIAVPSFGVAKVAISVSGTDGAKASDSSFVPSTLTVELHEGGFLRATRTWTPLIPPPNNPTCPAERYEFLLTQDEQDQVLNWHNIELWITPAKGTTAIRAMRVRLGAPLLGFLDGVVVSDNSTVTQNSNNTGRSGSITSDNSTAAQAKPQAGTDGTKSADNSTYSRTVNGTDGSNTSDTATVTQGHNKVGTDGAVGSDVIAVAERIRLLSATDGSKAQDYAPLISGGAFAGAGTDGSKVSDSATSRLVRAGIGTDGSKVSDTSTIQVPKLVSGTDGSKASDSAPIARVISVICVDGSKGQDFALVSTIKNPVVTDGAKWSESAAAVGGTPTNTGVMVLRKSGD